MKLHESSSFRREAITLLGSIATMQHGSAFKKRLESLLIDETLDNQNVGEAAEAGIPLYIEALRITSIGGVESSKFQEWVLANIPFNQYGRFMAIAETAGSLADVVLTLAMNHTIEQLDKEKKDADDSGSGLGDDAGSSGDSGGSAGFGSAEREVRLGEREGDTGDSSTVEPSGGRGDSSDRGQQGGTHQGATTAEANSVDGHGSV